MIVNSETSKNKKVQLNLTARECHSDYQALIEVKEMLVKMEKNSNLSKIQVLCNILSGNTLLIGNYTENEKENFFKISSDVNMPIAEIIRRGSLLYLDKLVKKKEKSVVFAEVNNEEVRQDSKISKNDLKVRGDEKVDEIVAEIMNLNNSTEHWWEKREINAKSIIDWGKKLKNYKSINYKVIKRYFMFHRDDINAHHALHEITPDHNRRAINRVRAINKQGVNL